MITLPSVRLLLLNIALVLVAVGACYGQPNLDAGLSAVGDIGQLVGLAFVVVGLSMRAVSIGIPKQILSAIRRGWRGMFSRTKSQIVAPSTVLTTMTVGSPTISTQEAGARVDRLERALEGLLNDRISDRRAVQEQIDNVRREFLDAMEVQRATVLASERRQLQSNSQAFPG